MYFLQLEKWQNTFTSIILAANERYSLKNVARINMFLLIFGKTH